MNDLDKALGDISSIRRQMARSTEFAAMAHDSRRNGSNCDWGSSGAGVVAT